MHPINSDEIPSSLDKQLALIEALYRRGKTVSDAGRAAVAAQYPHAPEAMTSTSAFHLYTDLPKALLELLCALELSLREPGRGVHGGLVYHPIYHLYNWLQFQELVPQLVPGLIELVEIAQESVADEDPIRLNNTLEELKRNLEACEAPPSFE